MAEQPQPRRNWLVLSCGLLFAPLGILFFNNGLAAHGNDLVALKGKYYGHVMTAEQAMFAGVIFALGGCLCLWSCFRKGP